MMVALVDDSQVVELHAWKRYGSPAAHVGGEEPRVSTELLKRLATLLELVARDGGGAVGSSRARRRL
jgi:hypothetical protein